MRHQVQLPCMPTGLPKPRGKGKQRDVQELTSCARAPCSSCRLRKAASARPWNRGHWLLQVLWGRDKDTGVTAAGTGSTGHMRVPCMAETWHTHRQQQPPCLRRPASDPAPLPTATAQPPFSCTARGTAAGQSPPPKGIHQSRGGFAPAPLHHGASESWSATTPPILPPRVPGMFPPTRVQIQQTQRVDPGVIMQHRARDAVMQQPRFTSAPPTQTGSPSCQQHKDTVTAPRLRGTGWHHLREDSYPFGVGDVRLCERVPLLGRPHARPQPLALLPVTQLQREGFDDDEGALQPPLQLCPRQSLQLLPGTAGDRERA